jgi:hypothetical protein
VEQSKVGGGLLCEIGSEILRYRMKQGQGPVSARALYQDLLLTVFRAAGQFRLVARHAELGGPFEAARILYRAQTKGDLRFTNWSTLMELVSHACWNVDIFGRTPTAERLLTSLPDVLPKRTQPAVGRFVGWLVSIAADETLNLGWLYETLLSQALSWRGEALVLVEHGDGARKQTGAYYTPDALVRFTVQRGLSALSGRAGNAGATRVCDPACGTGQLLVHCVGALTQLNETNQPLQGLTDDVSLNIVTQKVFGVDLDPVAVEICRFALLDCCGYPEEAWPYVWRNVRHGDALIGAIRKADAHQLGESFIEASIEDFRFDWYAAFPNIFDGGEGSGFDWVLGNPPWDKVEVLAREREDELLDHGGAQNHQSSVQERKHHVTTARQFIRESGQYPLTGHGRVNTYSSFMERGLNLVNEDGVCTMVVPTGIVTDYSTRHLVRRLLDHFCIHSLFDFDNRSRFFNGVQGNVQFCVLTVASVPNGRNRPTSFRMGGRLTSITEDSAGYEIALSLIERINPETGNVPVFSSARAMALVSRIYDSALTVGSASWFVGLRQGHFNMTTGRKHFVESLRNPSRGTIQLYEAKLCGQFEHRAATFDGVPSQRAYGVHPATRQLTGAQRHDPDYEVVTRYRVPKDLWQARTDVRPWFLVYRNTMSTVADSRSCVVSLLPEVAIGNSLTYFTVLGGARVEAAVLACLNSLVVDYVLREKATGSNLNFYVMRQLPMLDLAAFEVRAGWTDEGTILDFVVERVVRLIYSSHALSDFAQACGGPSEPLRLTELERLKIRCELDGLVCVLFGLEREDVAYMLERFTVLHRQEVRRYQKRATFECVLANYDRFKTWVGTD